MNQFRDILWVALLALGLGVGLTNPDDWSWASIGGAHVLNALHFLSITKPWCVVILLAVSLAIFMTRIKY
jgi:hypothetical protein